MLLLVLWLKWKDIMEKNILKSKTFWANVLAIVAMIIQTQTGFVVSPEIQTTVLGLINVILRSITKDSVSWRKNSQ